MRLARRVVFPALRAPTMVVRPPVIVSFSIRTGGHHVGVALRREP
jgi:hypothetical protein